MIRPAYKERMDGDILAVYQGAFEARPSLPGPCLRGGTAGALSVLAMAEMTNPRPALRFHPHHFSRSTFRFTTRGENGCSCLVIG